MSFANIAVIIFGLGVSYGVISLIRHVVLGHQQSRRQKDFHHTQGDSVPRLGGIGLAAAMVVVAVVAFAHLGLDSERTGIRLTMLIGALAMFGVGLWDDFKPLGARRKLLLQILVAGVVYALGVRIQYCRVPGMDPVALGMWSVVPTVLWLVALTNLINLIDGIDGLAGGISLMLMGLLACVSYSGLPFSFMISLGMLGALLGFLCLNFPPARIYMGDGGAYLLGFLIAVMAIEGSQKGTIIAALIAPIVALGIPILDTIVTVLRRGIKGLPIFRPDRQHIHHQLLASGLSRRRAVLTLYAMSLVFLGLAFGSLVLQHRYLPLLWGAGFLLLILAGQRCGLFRGWRTLPRRIEESIQLRRESRYALALISWFELDAERTSSPAELWQAFELVASKLGFSHVQMKSPGGDRLWQANGIGINAPGLWHWRITLDRTSLHFAAEPVRLPNHVFEHLAELAAESWHKAFRRQRETSESQMIGASRGELVVH